MISFSHLGLTDSLDLYKCAKAFADIVIPQVSRWNEQNEPWSGGPIVPGGTLLYKKDLGGGGACWKLEKKT